MNFMWIQARPDYSTANPIPQALLSNAMQFARNHPEVQVNIWLDLYGVGNNPTETINSLNTQERPQNVIYRSLDTVEGYTENPTFENSFTSWTDSQAFWDHIDVAKIYILRHLLNSGEEHALFSDMDIDFSKNFEHALHLLQTHGAVVGLDAHPKGTGIENQFFGFAKDHVPFISQVLLRTLKENEVHFEEYERFLYAFDAEYAYRYGINKEDISIPLYQLPKYLDIKFSYQHDGHNNDLSETPAGP